MNRSLIGAYVESLAQPKFGKPAVYPIVTPHQALVLRGDSCSPIARAFDCIHFSISLGAEFYLHAKTRVAISAGRRLDRLRCTSVTREIEFPISGRCFSYQAGIELETKTISAFNKAADCVAALPPRQKGLSGWRVRAPPEVL